MLNHLIRWSLRNRAIILCLSLLVLAMGFKTGSELPVEVLPDLTKPTVTILTEAPGLSPEEVEALVSQPIENSMMGVAGLTRMRSTSDIALSLVFAEFEWGTDIYKARQFVQERLQVARESLPEGTQPFLTPVTSLMGEILLIGVKSTDGKTAPMDVRTVADWTIRMRLQAIPGVAEVLNMGGGVKQAQIQPDPWRMQANGVTIEELELAARNAAANTTGGFIDNGPQEIMVRNLAMTVELEDLSRSIIKMSNGRPVAISDVATVAWGTEPKRGDAAVSGSPGVIMSVIKAPGFDTIALTEQIEAAIAGLKPTLPAGVEATVLFRQRDFIDSAIGNLKKAIIEGAVMVTLVLLLFLMSFRTSFITLMAMPLSFAVTLLTFKWFGLSVNSMTLGGLAVAIGMVVDDAIVDVENVFRRLRENARLKEPLPKLELIALASGEVRNSIFYATILIVLVFIPLLGLSGVEGKLFAPIAIATIIVLLAIALGPREAVVVAIAVPMTLAITLLLDLLFGYTINRVTLFALILSLGLLVDDPIVDVENIFRHFRLRREPPLDATLTAVDEVRPPTILATFTVIVSFLPMFFITGMMGPYMAPMAFNVPVAMLMSLIVAFTVTPWAAYHLLKGEYDTGGEEPFDLHRSAVYRGYRAVLLPLLTPRRRAALFLGAVGVAFVVSALLAVTRAVPLKMLPFDNKNEMALIVDMPAGSSLEATDAVARDLGRYLAGVAEVTDFESFVGVAAPMDFNGMVRHYYLRRGGNVGEVRINLLPKEDRVQQSHQIALRIRPDIERIGAAHGANVKIAEAPPGPPVISTVVAEVYGPLDAPYGDLVAVSKTVRAALAEVPGVVDVDDFSQAPHQVVRYGLDREKAGLTGVSVAEAAQTLAVAVGGGPAGRLHAPHERLPIGIDVRLPRPARSSAAELMAVRVKSATGQLVPLGEIGSAASDDAEQVIFHKNLRPVAFVIAEMAGRSPVEAVLAMFDWEKAHPLPAGYTMDLAGEGEWKITVDVFRDLGLAFAAALAMIYVLLVAQTGSLGVPLVIMIAIPLTLIGIMPGFWLLNLLFTSPVGEYANPVFFTATGMIGMIALAGIVVRNSIILIDFIEHIRARDPGMPLDAVIIEAGATRLRPIALTAAAAMFGSIVITLDPIFSGLAWSFIFGIFASTAFTLLVVPVVYYLIYRPRPVH